MKGNGDTHRNCVLLQEGKARFFFYFYYYTRSRLINNSNNKLNSEQLAGNIVAKMGI